MKLPVALFRSIVGKTVLAMVALGGFLLFPGAPEAKANDWGDSNRRVAYDQWRYNEAVEHFGPHSSQARYWAHERLQHFRHERRAYDGDGDRR